MEDNELIVVDENKKFMDIIENVREDIRDNPYIEETMRVLSVEGYRSAIGCFWNAVVDDLRNKILYRSINLFNKEMKPRKEIKTYEDFQDNVNDEMLLDGAYKIGIIGWEAHKVLKQAKETRNIFDGHPRSSNPTAIKALSLIEDCIKYVLSQEYPPQIIDIDEYIHLMEKSEFDRNEYVVSDALTDLPDIYKDELINRLLVAYIDDMCSTIMRANIEFVAPILWKVLRKETILQVVKTMEKEILKLLGEKDGEFFEGDVSGDTIILYSRIEKLFLKLQETIQKNVYELSDTTKKLIQNDAKIATNLYVIAAELIRWYSTKISDVANEKVVIDTAKWLRLSNRHFFDEYCDDKSLGSIFLQYVEKSDRNGQKKFVLYFFHILHYCPPNGFNEYMLNQNIGTNWYCKEK